MNRPEIYRWSTFYFGWMRGMFVAITPSLPNQAPQTHQSWIIDMRHSKTCKSTILVELHIPSSDT